MATRTKNLPGPGIILLSLCAAVVLHPVPALAVQHHGGAEGLVSHQLGHVLFFTGMVSLLIRCYRLSLNGPGWLPFRMFLWLIIGWNILTFSGHWLREIINNWKFVQLDSQIIGYQITGPVDLFFYLTRLDHLLLVPAFLCLLAALYRWREIP